MVKKANKAVVVVEKGKQNTTLVKKGGV